MSAEHVLTMLNEHEVKFVDLRFTDTCLLYTSPSPRDS